MMTVTTPGRLWIIVVVALACCAAGCASTPSDGITPEYTGPENTEPEDTEPEQTGPATVVGEGSDVSVAMTDLAPMDAVASLGYPRDLLDRGRVNIEISRDDDTDFVILDKQLVAEHFDPAPVEERRTVLPPSGQVVAVQTLFGEVSDCASTEPVSATLDVTFTRGDDRTHHTTSIPLTDATTLDAIRSQRCTVRQIDDENEIELRDPLVDGETMTVDLVVTRRDGTSRLGFDTIKGTVLFGASTVFATGSPERVLEPDEAAAVIPLDIDVNRCDSHAVAETTRKFGIDLYVSVDGGESQLIQVPIDAILADLETMLGRCTDRTGQ